MDTKEKQKTLHSSLDTIMVCSEYITEKVSVGDDLNVALYNAIHALAPNDKMVMEQTLNQITEKMTPEALKEYKARLETPELRVQHDLSMVAIPDDIADEDHHFNTVEELRTKLFSCMTLDYGQWCHILHRNGLLVHENGQWKHQPCIWFETMTMYPDEMLWDKGALRYKYSEASLMKDSYYTQNGGPISPQATAWVADKFHLTNQDTRALTQDEINQLVPLPIHTANISKDMVRELVKSHMPFTIQIDNCIRLVCKTVLVARTYT